MALLPMLAVELAALPAQLGRIFYFVLLPILLLAGVGYAIRVRLGLDMKTLAALNFYFTMPALIFTTVVTSSARVTPENVGSAILFAMALLAVMAVLTFATALALRAPRGLRNVLLMTTMFHNSGNYGLPLQEMAFRGSGLSEQAFMLQVVYMLAQNVTNFTIGIFMAAGGEKRQHWTRTLRSALGFPPIYALAAALLVLQLRRWLGGSAPAVAEALEPFWQALLYMKGAFIGLALVTLGAKLADLARDPAGYPVTASVVLRLVASPVAAVAITYLLGITGFVAQVMVIAASTPTAVNCMLLCLEFDNHPDYAARAVFYSSLISPVTVTLTIFFAQGAFLPHLAT